MSSPKAVIVGCAGYTLTPHERSIFARHNPFGLILFARNIESPNQLIALTHEFRACVGRADAPVLIDQEGGRVARLRAPQWDEFPSAAKIGALYHHDAAYGVAAGKILGRMLAAMLLPLGITVNCTPVLDVPQAGADPVIGDRAFSTDPDHVATLARSVCDGLCVGGVMPVIKHIPGHGRATADSHAALPVVQASLSALHEVDFKPFRALHDMPLAMTAHIQYPALDEQYCATLSPTIIQDTIRTAIGFDGLLITDDLTMKALSGDVLALARDSLTAGCDVALYCQSDEAVLDKLCQETPVLTPQALRRWNKAKAWLKPMELYDPPLAKAELQRLLSMMG